MAYSNGKKIGILFATLALPGLIFIMLKVFGKNYYELPVFEPVSTGCAEYQGADASQMPAFQLTDQHGQTHSAAQLPGKIQVVSFFSINCTEGCKEVFSQLRRAQGLLEDMDELTFLSFTLNPDQDSPQKLKEFAEQKELLRGNWLLLTGEYAEIHDLANCLYHFNTEVESEDNRLGMAQTRLVLMDNDGKIRGFYEGTNRKEIDRMVTEIQILQYMSENPTPL